MSETGQKIMGYGFMFSLVGLTLGLTYWVQVYKPHWKGFLSVEPKKKPNIVRDAVESEAFFLLPPSWTGNYLSLSVSPGSFRNKQFWRVGKMHAITQNPSFQIVVVCDRCKRMMILISPLRIIGKKTCPSCIAEKKRNLLTGKQ